MTGPRATGTRAFANDGVFGKPRKERQKGGAVLLPQDADPESCATGDKSGVRIGTCGSEVKLRTLGPDGIYPALDSLRGGPVVRARLADLDPIGNDPPTFPVHSPAGREYDAALATAVKRLEETGELIRS